MKSGKQTLIIAGSVLIAAILVLGGLFFINAQNKTDAHNAVIVAKKQGLEKQIKQAQEAVRSAEGKLNGINYSIKLEKSDRLFHAKGMLKLTQDRYWAVRKDYGSNARVTRDAEKSFEKEQKKVAVIRARLKDMDSSVYATKKNISNLKEKLRKLETELALHIAGNYPLD